MSLSSVDTLLSPALIPCKIYLIRLNFHFTNRLNSHFLHFFLNLFDFDGLFQSSNHIISMCCFEMMLDHK